MTTAIDTRMIMQSEGFDDKVKAQMQAMAENPVVNQLMEAAETIEDMYQVAKHYVQITFDKFAELYESATNFYKEKTELSDDTMEAVIGGASFWKWVKRIAVATAVVVAVAAACALTAGAAGAIAGVAGAAAHGAVAAAFGTTAALTGGAATLGGAATGGFIAGAAAGAGAGAFKAIQYAVK